MMRGELGLELGVEVEGKLTEMVVFTEDAGGLDAILGVEIAGGGWGAASLGEEERVAWSLLTWLSL